MQCKFTFVCVTFTSAFLMQVLLNVLLFVLPVGTLLSLSLGIDIREVSCSVTRTTRV